MAETTPIRRPLHWEVEPVNAVEDRKAAVIGGALGYGVARVLGGSPLGRLFAIGIGAFVGSWVARRRVLISWDPPRRTPPSFEPAPSARIAAEPVAGELVEPEPPAERPTEAPTPEKGDEARS